MTSDLWNDRFELLCVAQPLAVNAVCAQPALACVTHRPAGLPAHARQQPAADQNAPGGASHAASHNLVTPLKAASTAAVQLKTVAICRIQKALSYDATSSLPDTP